jgi:hypothetical protein
MAVQFPNPNLNKHKNTFKLPKEVVVNLLQTNHPQQAKKSYG